MQILQASKSSPIIQPSVLLGYETSMNPYVGCAGGCTFCYAQQMIKEPGYAWGDFVRTRDHIPTRMPGAWSKFKGRSLLLGSMTDPYQPIEKTARLTRATLEILLENNPPSRIGIFTRFPAVLEDVDLLLQFPQVTVHMSISPFAKADKALFEPGTPSNTQRFATIEKLSAAGIDCQSQISPLTPGFSDNKGTIRTILGDIAKSSLSVARLDPLQAYSVAQATMLQSFADKTNPKVIRFQNVMKNTKDVLAWANDQRDTWAAIWREEHPGNNTQLVWANHISFEWIDLVSGAVTVLPHKSKSNKSS